MNRRQWGAFNLIELLAVIAVMALVLAFLLPNMIHRRPPPARGLHCLSNTKQLTLGWIMYSTDWSEVLVSNRPYASTPGKLTNNWVAGVMNWTNNSDNTNRALLVSPSDCAMAPYIKTAEVYHCPADESVADAGPRVRSYALNAFLGGDTNAVVCSGWKMCLKQTELLRPSQTAVIVDEHPGSIDDGCFQLDPNRTNSWASLPASRHVGAAGISFADGHSEIHKWVEASTRAPVIPSKPWHSVPVARRERGVDLTWMLSAMTCPDTNSPTGP